MGEYMGNVFSAVLRVEGCKNLTVITPGKFIEAGKQSFFDSFTDENFAFAVVYEADAALFFFFFRLVRTGISSSLGQFFERQKFCQGQSRHCGFRGVQMTAPKSIIAEA